MFPNRFPGDRSTSELEWVQVYYFLQEHGYQLRQRYHPEWTPSWFPQLASLEASASLLYWKKFEDGLSTCEANIVDAVRTIDGSPVIIKFLRSKDRNSIPFAVFFSHELRRLEPRNHCAPLLDILSIPSADHRDAIALVFPRYLDWDLWPFVQVGEIADFLAQLFEGLAYMHENHAAHLDISQANIMMDGLHLLQEPCHPANPILRADAQGEARHKHRFEGDRPVKYYFIDFDQSIRFDNITAICPIERLDGQVYQAPELLSPPYDAFRLDVFCLGHVILSQILNAYDNVEFVRPLVAAMMHADPSRRPTAAEIVSRFTEIRRLLFPVDLAQDPGFLADYDWAPFYLGEAPARQPPIKRRASFSGADLPEEREIQFTSSIRYGSSRIRPRTRAESISLIRYS